MRQSILREADEKSRVSEEEEVKGVFGSQGGDGVWNSQGGGKDNPSPLCIPQS